jgi:hypothetical protein
VYTQRAIDYSTHFMLTLFGQKTWLVDEMQSAWW